MKENEWWDLKGQERGKIERDWKLRKAKYSRKVRGRESGDRSRKNDRFMYPYYNLRYNPLASFIRAGFQVSYRIYIGSAMEFSQNVLHYILHRAYIQGIYVIHIKSLSRYSQRTQDLTDKAKWRSTEASNNVNKHTGCWLFWTNSPPRIKFALVKFNSPDGSSYTRRRFRGAVFKLDGYH